MLLLMGTFALWQEKNTPKSGRELLIVEFLASQKMLRIFAISLHHTSPTHKSDLLVGIILISYKLTLFWILYSVLGTLLCNLLFLSFLLRNFSNIHRSRENNTNPNISITQLQQLSAQPSLVSLSLPLPEPHLLS